MDGSYEPSGRFPGYGDGFHHRHSHSTTTIPTSHNHHLNFDYAAHAHAHVQLSSPAMSHMEDATPMHQGGNPYESHDDLCVDRCMGVGIYGGFQQFNHRGSPLALQARWQGGLLPTRDDMLAHQDYSLSFGTTMQFQQPHLQQNHQHQPEPQLQLQHQHQHHQQQHQYLQQHQPQPQQQPQQQTFNNDLTLSSSHHQFQSFFDQPQQPHAGTAASMSLCEDDDCQSVGDSGCCDSQCTMTGKCTAPECEAEEDACYDQNCPSRPDPVPEEVRDGAAALISINHAPEQSQNDFNFQQQPEMNHLNFNFSSNSQDNFLLTTNFLPDSVGVMANHLLNAHAGTDASSCTRPCPLDDPQNYRFCHMPVYNNMDFFKQYADVGSSLQMKATCLVECGAEITDPDAFTAHFFSQHKDLFTGGLTNFPSGPNSLRGNALNGASSEIMSPMAPPLDTSDASPFSGTPSPLTPTSNNVDMPDAKATDLSHSRSESVTSSGDNSTVNLALEEHRCLWREEGSKEICGLVFSDAEALFRHASNSHIKHAQKGAQGFRCGWDDCPRSEQGQIGFPQRSKIERHMQTHIGHKPHICEICNKGFSAKQALTQHMFIHSNEKPLVCHICGKAFRYPSALTMHQRVHTGLKPLNCPICNKGFSESSNLSKHKRTHEMKGRFNCPIAGCDRNFHRQDQLRRHMKTHPREGGGDESRSSEAPEASPTEISFDHPFQA
ncbi:zinc-responsive transcriptional regulator ZAP1 [Cladorrhinum sp. PSN259]|nr:zinc-responsive transcriptional regulator ZAP1 [Cladorrhinum sp. PSN259]